MSAPGSRPDGDDWSIEALRGVAALIVVYAHYAPQAGWPQGPLRFAFTGVDLFFVVSGLVFAPYFFGKPLPALPFFVRRFFRIYPLYLCAVLAYAALRWAGQLPVEHLGKHLLFLHTWQTREIAFELNPAFWSLPPEVEFYLALPLLVRWVQGLRAVLALFAAAAALHVVLAALSPARPDQVNLALALSLHLPGLLVEFLLGVLAWCGVRAAFRPGPRAALLVAGMAGWWVLASVFDRLGDAGVVASALLRGNLSLAAAVCFAAGVVAWVGWLREPPRALRVAALAAGHLSYGLYLFHNAAPELLRRLALPGLEGPVLMMASLALAVGVAAVLHFVLEAPARAFGRAHARLLELRTTP